MNICVIEYSVSYQFLDILTSAMVINATATLTPECMWHGMPLWHVSDVCTLLTSSQPHRATSRQITHSNLTLLCELKN